MIKNTVEALKKMLFGKPAPTPLPSQALQVDPRVSSTKLQRLQDSKELPKQMKTTGEWKALAATYPTPSNLGIGYWFPRGNSCQQQPPTYTVHPTSERMLGLSEQERMWVSGMNKMRYTQKDAFDSLERMPSSDDYLQRIRERGNNKKSA